MKNVNPYHKDEKKIKEKEIRDNNKKKPKEAQLSILVIGETSAQNYFWKSIDKITSADDVRLKYQKAFLQVLVDITLTALKSIKLMQLFDELSPSGQLLVVEFQQASNTFRSSIASGSPVEIGSLPKILLGLWKESVVASAISQIALFHPNKELIFKFVFIFNIIFRRN